MIKLTSILFIFFAILMIVLGIGFTIVPNFNTLHFVINLLAVCLLITGITLIISLIFDRFKHSESEKDHR